MHRSIVILILIGLLLLAALPALAQDATPAPVSTPVEQRLTYGGYPEGTPLTELLSVLIKSNICLEDLLAGSQDTIPAQTLEWIERGTFEDRMRIPVDSNMPIPVHEDCYITVEVKPDEISFIERDYNVCIEEYDHLVTFSTNMYSAVVYLPKAALPCVNEAGQRLTYFDENGQWLDIPRYSPIPFVELQPVENDTSDDQFILQLGYCMGDLMRANPALILPISDFEGEIVARPGTRVFVPPNTRSCEFTRPTSETFYDMSKQLNVCVETLLEASGWTDMRIQGGWWFSIPVNTPACYDEQGQRVGRRDRAVHTPQLGESFLDIARAYDVCPDDLWDANPVMNSWTGLKYEFPDVFFIPDAPPCQPLMQYTVRKNQTLRTITILTNICGNRLSEANPAFEPDMKVVLPAGIRLTLPERPHCYDLDDEDATEWSLRMQPYVCYSVSVTDGADFTNHQPSIVPSSDTDLPYCYERTDDMTIFYENKPYTLHRLYGYESIVLVAQCFGVKLDNIYLVDATQNPWGLTYLTQGGMERLILIPQPHDDCELIGLARRDFFRVYRDMEYKAGYLIDGVYHVNYNDTLSSIGRTYGYPYQWIADANGLTDPNAIYYLQELKLPPYPSLYTLAPVGGAGVFIMLASTAIYGLRRLIRRRAAGKKKNG